MICWYTARSNRRMYRLTRASTRHACNVQGLREETNDDDDLTGPAFTRRWTCPPACHKCGQTLTEIWMLQRLGDELVTRINVMTDGKSLGLYVELKFVILFQDRVFPSEFEKCVPASPSVHLFTKANGRWVHSECQNLHRVLFHDGCGEGLPLIWIVITEYTNQISFSLVQTTSIIIMLHNVDISTSKAKYRSLCLIPVFLILLEILFQS